MRERIRVFVWVSLALGSACGAGERSSDDGFDFPVGPPDGAGYYDAQGFGVNAHLGEDWNGSGGADTDLGDPVYAIGAGRVRFAEDAGGGWGNVVRVVHRYRGDDGAPAEVEAVYAHLDVVLVRAGATVARRQLIGTIGTAHGQYLAHLHLELRRTVGLPLGGGYGEPVTHLAPTEFIVAHRPRR